MTLHAGFRNTRARSRSFAIISGAFQCALSDVPGSSAGRGAPHTSDGERRVPPRSSFEAGGRA